MMDTFVVKVEIEGREGVWRRMYFADRMEAREYFAAAALIATYEDSGIHRVLMCRGEDDS